MKKISGNFSRWIKVLFTAAVLTVMLGMTASAAGNVFVDFQRAENGAYVYAGKFDDYNTTVYHKIYVPSSSAMVLSGYTIYQASGSTSPMKVELYNANLNRIESQYGQWVDANENRYAVYGVKKGTYYIKTSGSKTYVLAAALQKTTNKGGTSKSRAYTIKQNRTIQGVMPAGEKSSASDWYKFKVTRSRVLQLKLDTANSGYFEFYLYGPSYKNGIKIDSLKNEKGTYYSINSRTKRKMSIKTGTYYIRVKRQSNVYSKNCSGIYSIKWRLK